tara:strand:+ start:22 stop:588 length:567 start_codon:yes stop_codon:yes gene_type:complete
MTTETTAPSKLSEAEAITNHYVGWAMGAGLIPFPLADLAAITGVQLKMLKEISGVYGVEFSENRGKSIVLSLISSLGSTSLAVSIVGSVAKIVPGVGSFFSFATLPVVAGALTFATGKVFTQHFESGGTFLSFDASGAKNAFAREFQNGKECVKTTAGKVETKFKTTADKVESKIDDAVNKVTKRPSA